MFLVALLYKKPTSAVSHVNDDRSLVIQKAIFALIHFCCIVSLFINVVSFSFMSCLPWLCNHCSTVCLHCWHYDVHEWWHHLLICSLWDVIKQQLQQLLAFHKSSTCKAANSPDFCGSFPNLRLILRVYDFLMKLPTSVNIQLFPAMNGTKVD